MNEEWNRKDWVALAALSLVALVFWWPTRALPYHWDSATFVIRAARDLVNSDFSPLIAEHSDFAHPPLFVASLALTWKLFGQSLLISHLFLLPLVVASVAFTYLLGRRQSRAVGLAATTWLLSTPVFLSEIGQIYFDLPLAGLSSLGILLWFRGRPGWAVLVLSACAAIKIPTLVFPCALLLPSAFVREERKKLPWLLAPFATVAAWLAYHDSVTGWLLSRPGRDRYAPDGIGDLFVHAWQVGRILLDQWRWVVPAAACIAGLVWMVRTKTRRIRPSLEDWTLLLIPVGGIFFFALAGEFGQRYGIMLMPAIFVLCAGTLHRVLGEQKLAFWAIVTLGTGLFVRGWVPDDTQTSRYTLSPDADLGYLDMVSVGIDTAEYLQNEHPDALLFGFGPEFYWLREPYQGYVKAPMEVVPCSQFRPSRARKMLLITHLYDARQRHCWDLRERSTATLIKKVRHNAKWVGIFELRPPGSAPRTTSE